MEGTDKLQRVPLRENPDGQGLILLTLGLMGLGVIMAVGAGSYRPGALAWYYQRDVRQAIFAAAALAMLCTLWRVDYRWLTRSFGRGGAALGWLLSPAALLLCVSILAAAAVLVFGREVRGSERFFRWGPIGFQPSEIVKFALIIALAALVAGAGARVRSFKAGFLPAALLTAVACGVVAKEDFGTAAILGVAALAVMLIGGTRWRHLLVAPPAAAAGFYWLVYRVPYRWARIVAMVQPFDSSHPSAYQPRQSVIAIGSGADPAGVGAGAARYGYLPDANPDFIFSVICQEMGLLGAILVTLMLVCWLYLVWRVARRCPDRFGSLLAGGLGVLVGLQAAVHIAVAVWWLPPTGVSLPFVSYGGTALLATAAATALIVSISARRPADGLAAS